jgi:hypothetical protein
MATSGNGQVESTYIVHTVGRNTYNNTASLLGTRAELGHGLCALGYGVLSEFTRQDQPDTGLDLARRYS